MTDQELLELAKGEGFAAALIRPEQIPVDPKFRAFCEENLCGKYNANYGCPPDCGTVESMHQSILAEEKALILETVWEIAGYEDKPAVEKAKISHNAAALRLLDKLRRMGYEGFVMAVRCAIPVNGRRTSLVPSWRNESPACPLTVSTWQNLPNAAIWNMPGRRESYIYSE